MISNMGDEIRSTYIHDIQVEGSTVLTTEEKKIVESNDIKCKQRIHVDSEGNYDKDDDDDKNGEHYDSDEFYFDDNGGEGYDVGDDFEDSDSAGDVDKADSDRDGMNDEVKIKDEVGGQEVKTETNDASNTFDDDFDSWKHLLTEEEYEAQRYRYNYRYNLRRRSSSTYMHLEVADDDNFLYCEDCKADHFGDCPIHGPLLWIKDTETPDLDPHKARHSLPPGLKVKLSGIPDAGRGVWSTKMFPTRVMFGPYGGEILPILGQEKSSGYAWQICHDGRPIYTVDGIDRAKSNWMRYVNCAPSESEQNLIAFQYKGAVYYRTYKPIPPGTELLVWYGNVYARDLGIIPGGNQSDSLPDGSPATSDNCTATPSTLTRKRRRIKLPNECFPKRKLKFVLKNNTGIPKKHEVESNSGTVKMQQSALREEYMSTFHSGVNAQKPKTNAATSLERKTDPNLLAKFVYKKYFEKVKKSKMLDAKTRLGDLLKYLRFNLKTETYKHQSCINGRNGLDKVGNGNQETEENTKCSPRPKQIDLKNENELSGSRKPDGDKTIKSLAAVKGVSDPVSPDSKKEQEDNDSKRRKEKENRDPRTVICDSKYDNNSQKNEPCFKGGNVKHVHKSDKATENNSAWEQIRRWKIPCKSEHRKASMSDRIQNEFHIADKDKTIRSSPLPVDCSSQSHSGEETVSTISSDSGSRKRPRSHSRSHSESRSDVEITTKTNERLLEKCTEHGDKSSERNQQRERNMVLYKSTDSYSKSATSTRNCMHGSSTYRNSLHNYKRNIELSTRNKLSRGSYHDRYKRRQDNDNCRRNRRISDSLYDSDTYTSYSSSPQSPNHHMSRKFYDRSHSRERSVDSFSDNNETPKHRRRDRDCVMKGGHGLKTDIQKTNNIENIKRNEKSSPQSSNYNMSQRSWNRPFCRNTHVESLSENNETSKYRQRGRTHENEDNFSKKYAENVKRTEVSSSRHQKDEKPYQRHESRSDRLSEKENCAHKSDIITFGEQNSEKKQIKCEPNGCDDKTKAHPATQKLTTLSIPQLPSNKNVKTSTYVKFQCLKDENFHGKRESQGIKDDKYSDIHKNKISTTKSKQNRLDQQQVDFHGVVFMESHVDSLVTSLSPSVLSKEDRTSLLTPNTGQTQESNHSTMGIESKTNSVAVLPTISRMKHSIGESSPVVAEKDVGISIFHKMSPNVAGELREAAFLKHFNVQSSTESYSDSESTTDFENDQLAVISELVQINNLINAQAKLKILACHINESMDSSELMEISKLLNTQDQLNELSRQYMESQTSETGEDNGSNFTIPTSLIHDFQNSLSDIAAINGEADMDIASPTHDVGYIELPSSYASSVESKDVIDMEIGSPINNTGYIELDMEMGSPIINRGKIELAPCHKSLNDEHVLDLVGNNRTIDMEMGSPIHKTGRIEVLKSSLTESQSDCITRKRDNIKTSRNLANDFGIQSGSHNEDKVVGCTEASTTITMPSLLNSSFLGHNGTDFNKELLDKYMNDFLITKAKDSTSFCPSQHSNDEVTSENSRFGYNISQMGPEKQNLDNEMRIKDFLKTELDQENKMLVKNVRDKEISANIIMKQECLKNELDQGIKTYETVIMDSLKVEPVMAAKSNVIKACDKAELVKDITVKNHVIKCCDKAEQAKDITAKSKVIKDRQMAEQAKDITAKSKVIKDRQMAEQAKDITAKSKVIKDRQMAEQAKDITAESKVIKDRQMAEQAKDITAKSKVIKDRQMAEQAKDITAESKVIKDRQMAEQAKDITAKSKVAKDRQRVEQAKDMTAKSMVINGCKKEEPVKVLMANNMVVKDNQRIPDKLETSKRMSDQNMSLEKTVLQERVVEEVDEAIKPFYKNKVIDKDQYKKILRKAVPKICKSGDVNPVKIKNLINAYVAAYT